MGLRTSKIKWCVQAEGGGGQESNGFEDFQDQVVRAGRGGGGGRVPGERHEGQGASVQDGGSVNASWLGG